MKMDFVWITILLSLLGGDLCIGQSNGPANVASWGKSVQGVQLTITTTNDVVVAGWSMEIIATITNASRNVVQLLVTLGESDIKLVLTNAAGRLYMLTPVAADSERSSEPLEPGKASVSKIEAVVSKDIPPGDYTLTGYRYGWFTNSGYLKLESKSLKLQISSP